MSSSDDEASTELGAGGATQPVTPMPGHESESDDDDEEDVGKKKRTLKKDQREWESVATIQKGEHQSWDLKKSAGFASSEKSCTSSEEKCEISGKKKWFVIYGIFKVIYKNNHDDQ